MRLWPPSWLLEIVELAAVAFGFRKGLPSRQKCWLDESLLDRSSWTRIPASHYPWAVIIYSDFIRGMYTVFRNIICDSIVRDSVEIL